MTDRIYQPEEIRDMIEELVALRPDCGMCRAWQSAVYSRTQTYRMCQLIEADLAEAREEQKAAA